MYGIEIVDGCNAVYIYQGDECRCAGADTTPEEVQEWLDSDPAGFLEAWDLEELVQCEVCKGWTDHGQVICISLGNPPKGAWVCKDCKPSLHYSTTPKGVTRVFTDPEDAAYWYHFGDGYSGVNFLKSQGVL